MNENEPIFKTVLYVDDKVVATSNNLILWQSVLSSIKCNDSQPLNAINKSENKDNESKAILSPVEKFAKEIDIEVDLIKDALNPTMETPFIHLDMKTWENYKKQFANKRALPDVVIVGTILALWKKSANLGDVMQKDVIAVLKQLNISSNNATRSYKNCEWLKYESNKIILMASKFSLAQNMLIEYCKSV